MTTTTMTTIPPLSTPSMSRARSEADRWRLVREFETSFNGVRPDQATVLSSTGSRSWLFPGRGGGSSNTTVAHPTVDDNPFSNDNNKSQQQQQAARGGVLSKHNSHQQAYKVTDDYHNNNYSATQSPTRPRTKSTRRFSLNNKTKEAASSTSTASVIPMSKRRPIEYDLSKFAQEHEQQHVAMRTPSPVALGERKSSFFGRAWFAQQQHDGGTTVTNDDIGGFEPIIPQQSMLPLPRHKSGLFVRNSGGKDVHTSSTKAPPTMTSVPHSHKPETTVMMAAPPLMSRSSSIFTKFFPRKRQTKQKNKQVMDIMPTLPSISVADDGKKDNETESDEGSYDFDEEIAMASCTDFPLPDALLSEQQKHQQQQNRVIDVNDYDKDHRNPVDRWSPSPVPELTPETQNKHVATSFINAPKRPVRQQSLKHDFNDDNGQANANSLNLKSNLMQERQELMQQMQRVENLLQGLIQEDAVGDQQQQQHHHDHAESKAGEATEMVLVQQPQTQALTHHRHVLIDDGTDDDDDDDSTYSMLSGIMASWMAERDAATLKSACKGASSATRARMSVRFDKIIVREYERVVGDNPSCSSGPPISIGWNFLPAEDFPIDEYETRRGGAGRTRREFYLPPSKRTDLLLQDWNCRPEDIRKARRDATYIQYCREKSGSMAGKSSKVTEAAFLRKANRKLQKNRPDVSDDTLEPPCVPTRPGSPFCDVSPPMSLPIQPSRQPSVGKLLIVNDDNDCCGGKLEI